ncbi:MAG: hypothetical protein JJ974_01065 [Phycisphaerales bacterium]|nr:hypothetical protein [Phycisphaerales bacterium]
MRNDAIRVFLAAGVLGAITLSAGCNRVVSIREEVTEADDGMVRPGPFAPSEMRIHPLTHVESVGDVKRIVLHMELRDGWGDTVKGIGAMSIQLGRSGSASIGQSGTRWDIDLRDFETNVSYFDSVTRTYRFVLSGLPDWFTADGRGRLRVQYRTGRTDGSIESMQDDFQLLDIKNEG